MFFDAAKAVKDGSIAKVIHVIDLISIRRNNSRVLRRGRFQAAEVFAQRRIVSWGGFWGGFWEVYGGFCGAHVFKQGRFSSSACLRVLLRGGCWAAAADTAILIAAARQISPLLKKLPCSKTSATTSVGAGHSGDSLFTPCLGWLSLIFLDSHIIHAFLFATG